MEAHRATCRVLLFRMSSLLTACLCATLDSLLTGQIISLLHTDIMMKEEAPGPSPALVPSAEFAEELQTSGSFDREKQEQRNVTPFRRGSPWNFWSSALYHCGGRRARKGIVILGSCLVMLGLSSSLSWSCTYPYMFAYLQHAGSTWQYRHCAWVSVMQLAGLLMTLPLGSMLETRIGPRWTVCLGALIGFSGSFGVSFAVGSYWAILFLYGLVQGMGAGLQMAPASTVPLRWQPDKVNLLLNLRCTAFMLGPCIFIPMNILGADYSSTPTTIHSVSDNMRSDSGTVTGQQQLVTSQAYLSFPSWGPSILQAVAGVTLALQLCGGVLLDNPPWTQRWQRRHVNEGQKERKPASPVTPSVETSIHSCVADSSDVKKPASQHQPRAAVTNRLLPGESISGFVTRCSTLRQAYLAHFIVPFTVSDVSDDERIDLESSDDAYTDDETRPLNLAAVIREYQESAQRRHSAKTEEAILSETEGYHDADSPLQFPVGVDPAHIFPAEEDWDEAELSLSSAEETDSEQGGSDK